MPAAKAPMWLDIDPHGDVELVLTNPNAQTWKWPSVGETFLAALGVGFHGTKARDDGDDDDDDETKKSSELRMFVSSRHLSLASCVFRNMLTGPWKESAADESRTRYNNSGDEIVSCVRASEWDVEAFLIILNIIHGNTSLVPRTVSLELLVKIAVIVDYYSCHEAIGLMADLWINDLNPTIPSSFTYGEQGVLWMTVSWVFLREDILRETMFNAIKQAEGPLETMGLPLPESLVRFIGDARASALTSILKMLDELQTSLMQENPCTHGCLDMLVGALARQRNNAGILSSHKSYFRMSVNSVVSRVLAFESPPITIAVKDANSGSWRVSEAICHSRLQKRIRPLVEACEDALQYVNMKEVWEKRMNEAKSAKEKALAKRALWESPPDSSRGSKWLIKE